jgi:hypothetical protein
MAMVEVIADDSALLKRLGLYHEPVEIYDTAGKLLGLFVPANQAWVKEHYARLAQTIDRAELERRAQSTEGWEPLHVTLERLRKLEEEVERRRRAGEPEFTTAEGLAFFQALREADSSPTVQSVPVAEGSHALDRDVPASSAG